MKLNTKGKLFITKEYHNSWDDDIILGYLLYIKKIFGSMDAMKSFIIISWCWFVR